MIYGNEKLKLFGGMTHQLAKRMDGVSF